MRILVTGGAGFIGSHTAEYFAEQGHDVAIIDNLSRAELLKKQDVPEEVISYDWNHLARRGDIELIRGDIIKEEEIARAARGADVIVHAAAQTAVTTSLDDPRTDFLSNCVGTFNVLEAARANRSKLLYCSTNKVYGDNVNKVPIAEGDRRYRFTGLQGIDEGFSTDLCEHTPYGSSKFSGDIYAQDYARTYGLETAVFRMSCIYGTRQMGFEDQGWVAWFAIAASTDKQITIYGDGKQVRDVLHVSDLVQAYDAFINSGRAHGVYNIGGGPQNTISLLELVDQLRERTGKPIPLQYQDWRPSDQKVYISDISKAQEELGWQPKIDPRAGVDQLIDWVEENKELFL